MNRRKLIFSLLVALGFGTGQLSAQIIQSNGTGGGEWNSPGTWAGGIVPAYNTSSQIIIRTGDNVSIPNGVTVIADQLTVQAAAELQVSSGATLSMNNGTGNDLIMVDNGASFGLLNVDGLLEFLHGAVGVESGSSPSPNTTSTTVKVRATGIYRHRYTSYSGAVIGAEWQDGSTLEITGLTSASQIPTNLNQSFYNVTWNCPFQSNQLNLGGVLATVRGDLQILSTGTQTLYIFGSVESKTINIGNDFLIGGNAKVILSTASGNVLNVENDFIINTSYLSTQLARVGILTLNVSNDLLITSSLVYAATTGTLNLNLGGDLFLNGTFTVQSGGVTNLNFAGTSQSLSGSLFSGLFNFNISTGTDLDLGTSALVSPGTFNLQSGATIRVGSTNATGAISSSETLGNIQIPIAKRTFSSGSRIIYNGQSSQFLGGGHPSSALVTTIFENSAGVSLVTDKSLGFLEFNGGNLKVGAQTLTLQSPVTSVNGYIDVISTSNIIVTGSGGFGILPLTPDGLMNNLTISRSGGIATLISNLNIGGTLGLNSGDLDFSNVTLTLTGSMSSASGRFRANTNSSLFIGGTGSFASAIAFNAAANTVGSIILNRPGTTAGISGNIIVTGSLELIHGRLNNPGTLFLADGATLVRGDGELLFNRISNNPGEGYNVEYLPSGSITTALELPSALDTDDLLNLTITSGTISLTQNIIVNGYINFNGGTFSASVRQITLDGLQWNVNGGTFNPGTSSVIFTSAGSSIAGAGSKSFNHLTINSGAQVSLQNETISIAGNLVATGDLIANQSQLNFNGTVSQTIDGNNNSIYNININKTGGSVTLISSLNLIGQLSFATATVFNSNGFLTLLSSGDKPAVDASVGELPSGASVVGNVRVQRYFGAIDNYNRFISSPVTGATVAQLQQAFAVTGSFTGSSYPCTGCLNNGTSLKWYRESDSGDSKQGYVAFPGSGGTNQATLTPGVGYEVYMWNGVAPTTVNFNGTINTGTIDLGIMPGSTLGHTSSNPVQPLADGWNMVGNPYPSAIQWNNGAGWAKTNIDPTVWVWDVVGRVWHSYNANTATGDLTDGVIATAQAFWVYAPTPGSSSITINEQAKSSAGSGSYYRQRVYPVATIQLRKDNVVDEAYFVKSDEATSQYDIGLDALKLQLGIEQLSISILNDDYTKFGHFGVAPNFTSDFKLGVFGDVAGYYELVINPGQVEEMKGYYLVDSEEQKVMRIDGNTVYGFSVKDSSLGANDRFYLTQTIPSFAVTEVTTLNLKCYPNPVGNEELTITVDSNQVRGMRLIDQMGKVVRDIAYFSEEGSTFARIDMKSAKAGIYFVRVLTDQGLLTQKVIKH